jgi:hypothetical protein
LPLAVACDSSTAPKDDRPALSPNTVAARVKGATIDVEGTFAAEGGYLHVTGGAGSGVHLEGDLDGFPLVIHIPGVPTVGKVALGRWDLTTDHARQDSVALVGRDGFQSVVIGPRPAAAVGYYTGLGGGTLEIDAVEIPSFPDRYGTGSIRGRVSTRAALDKRLLPQDILLQPDTVDIVAEFLIALQSWADGRGAAKLVGGARAGESASMIGSGSIYYLGDARTDTILVVGLAGHLADQLAGDDEPLQLWLATRLRKPGEAMLEAIAPDDIYWSVSRWPDHFVGGRLGERRLASLGGTVRIELHEEYGTHGDGRYGEVKGRFTVDLVVADSVGGAGEERIAAEVEFHLPVMYFFHFEDSALSVARDWSGIRRGTGDGTTSDSNMAWELTSAHQPITLAPRWPS